MLPGAAGSQHGWFVDQQAWLTRSEEHGDAPDPGLHELGVDARHVRGRQAVLVVTVADRVDPGHRRHVAKQQHPLQEGLLGLVTTWEEQAWPAGLFSGRRSQNGEAEP